MIVRMWEATVVPGQYDAAVEWVRHDLVKRALFTAGCMAAEILVHEGTPESVVLLTRWDVAPVFEEAAVLRGWAGFYEVTPDDNPLVGPVPELGGLLVAAGFSGHGFMQGPAIGKVVAEMVVDGESSAIDVSAFRPSRFQEGALAQEHNVI